MSTDRKCEDSEHLTCAARPEAAFLRIRKPIQDARKTLFVYRLLRDQRELAQVVIIERTLSVGGLI